ncbi:MAG: precorrin-6Y C5,15-methyltransferase (decarboxylating) subunit CbiT [Selenomonadaceae bacterium]|nr:precorrin-6Y C5,15-methyltransferase (decarboxylating) subunit CbiT [Selenomonadaceae bacterium]
MIGIEDEKFIRGKVPMTKQEIRILTIAKAQICATDYVVDIGAGTGSLSIESAKIAEHGYVFAIDKNPEAIDLITQNAEKFSVDNIIIINSEAPDALRQVPRIDIALIGGSGGRIVEILNAIDEKLKTGGRIVANFITIQSLAAMLDWLKKSENYIYDAMQIQINKLQNVGGYSMSQALNPVHIVTAKKFPQKKSPNIIKLPVDSQESKSNISSVAVNR